MITTLEGSLAFIMKQDIKKDLKVVEVAERLGLSIYDVSRYCRRGLFTGAYKKNPFSIRRSEWFIPEESVKAFEQARKDQGAKKK